MCSISITHLKQHFDQVFRCFQIKTCLNQYSTIKDIQITLFPSIKIILLRILV